MVYVIQHVASDGEILATVAVCQTQAAVDKFMANWTNNMKVEVMKFNLYDN
jgi:hypothetical protein